MNERPLPALLLCLLLLVGAGVSRAAGSAPVDDGLVAGRDYQELPQALWQSADQQVEVVEYFSWGCPHCDAFHGQLDAWVAKLPAGVHFERVPVTLGHAAWQPLLRTYYALQNLGVLDRQMDDALFDAIHRQGLDPSRIDNIADWLATRGVDRARFLDATGSEPVRQRIDAAREAALRYGVQGVPLLIVGGRYLVLGNAAQSYADLLAVADRLVARLRRA